LISNTCCTFLYCSVTLFVETSREKLPLFMIFAPKAPKVYLAKLLFFKKINQEIVFIYSFQTNKHFSSIPPKYWKRFKLFIL